MNASPSSNTTGWWLAWVGGVIGGPSLGFACVAIAGDRSDGTAIAIPILCILGLILHIAASLILSPRIAARRSDESRRTATTGLTLGLLFGGWAVMFAVFFVGCLATLAQNIGR